MNRDASLNFILGVVIVAFAGAWLLLAQSLPLWGDEVSHLQAAKGFIEKGRPVCWNFDTGRFDGHEYTRALTMTGMTAQVMRGGGESLLAVRAIPLVFTVLLLGAFLIYARVRQQLSALGLALVVIFFLGQAVVLEKALYLRFYPPLACLALVAFLAFWEAWNGWLHGPRRNVLFCGLLLGAAFLFPILDHWQIQHAQILVFAILIAAALKISRCQEWLERYRGLVAAGVGLLLLVAPVIVMFNDVAMSSLSIGNRVIGRTFVTYWDNLLGLSRFILELNVVCLGMFWKATSVKDGHRQFWIWLYWTGIISGIATGLFTPHNHVFFSRFFYIPIILAVLGFAGRLATEPLLRDRQRFLISGYLLINTLLSVGNFYLDRNNLRVPIRWLKQNVQPTDTILVYMTHLQIQGGAALIPQVVPIKAGQDWQEVDRLIALLEGISVGKIYFLYSDEYQWRDRLYQWTTGEDRSPPSEVFRFLKEMVPSVQILSNLRACGLVSFDRDVVLFHLRELKARGFDPLYKSPEKRLLKSWWEKRSNNSIEGSKE